MRVSQGDIPWTFHLKIDAEWLKSDRQTIFLTRSMVSLLALQYLVNIVDFLPLGKPCFVCEIEGDKNVSTNNSCPCCYTSFDTALKLLRHVTVHILYDPSIKKEDEPCRLCLLPALSCQIALKKCKTTFTVNYANSTCQGLVKFSYTAASQPSASNPCSNVPVSCPQCPKGSNMVWKYNMTFHYIKKHSPAVPPKEFDVSDFELEGLKLVWNNHHAAN